MPKTRQITRWLLSRPDHPGPADQAGLAAIRARCPHLDALAGHVRGFAEMMTRRQGLLAPEEWLTRVDVTFKMIKRQMFGRAGFALLRKRVMLHPG